MIDRTIFPRRRRQHARPQELLDAALGLFIEKGFAAARANEIAARAGVCKGTLYFHFGSKEALLKELIAQRFSSRFAISVHEASDARASLDVLREVVVTWRSAFFEGEAGGIVKLLFTEARNFPVLDEFWIREVIAPTRQLVSRIVKQGIENAELTCRESRLGGRRACAAVDRDLSAPPCNRHLRNLGWRAMRARQSSELFRVRHRRADASARQLFDALHPVHRMRNSTRRRLRYRLTAHPSQPRQGDRSTADRDVMTTWHPRRAPRANR